MCFISTPTFLASSRDASARFGHSLIARIPWSVQFNDIIKVGMETSLACVVSPSSDYALLSFQRQDRGRAQFSLAPYSQIGQQFCRIEINVSTLRRGQKSGYHFNRLHPGHAKR